MGAYQTLREEGLLPLAEIDAEGNMREYTADLDMRGCPKVIDVGQETAYHPEKCRPRTGLVAASSCSPTNDAWCAEGVVAVNKSQGPIILLAQGTGPWDRRWRHLFEAVSEDARCNFVFLVLAVFFPMLPEKLSITQAALCCTESGTTCWARAFGSCT